MRKHFPIQFFAECVAFMEPILEQRYCTY